MFFHLLLKRLGQFCPMSCEYQDKSSFIVLPLPAWVQSCMSSIPCLTAFSTTIYIHNSKHILELCSSGQHARQTSYHLLQRFGTISFSEYAVFHDIYTGTLLQRAPVTTLYPTQRCFFLDPKRLIAVEIIFLLKKTESKLDK